MIKISNIAYYFYLSTLQCQISGGGTIAIFQIFAHPRTVIWHPLRLGNFENFQKITENWTNFRQFLLNFIIFAE